MRPFRRMSAVFTLLLVAVLANLAWVQVLDAEALRNREDNTRVVLQQFNRARGPIIVGADPIATSSRSAVDGFYQRSYTAGPLYAAVTGYSSLLYGSSGIERSQNSLLAGTDSRLFVDRIQQLFAGQRQAGGAVTVTIDATAQRAAFQALAGQRGAAVAMDARTGALLAVVSQPSFDPQLLAPNDPTSVRKAYEALVADPAQPLRNRAVDTVHAPGSVFEVVAAAAALASGQMEAGTELPDSITYRSGGELVRNPDGRRCGNGSMVTLQRALRRHCAAAFAWLGDKLGREALRDTAEQFGFNSSPNAQLPAAPSTYAGESVAPALLAIGERGVRTTTLQMAMVGSALANGGSLMNPYIVLDVRAQNLQVLDHARPHVRSTPLSTRDADALSRMLLGINGRSDCADCTLAGQPVHSITGAPLGNGPSWALAYAGRVAVAVMVEDGSGQATALDAAVAVLRAVLVKA